MMMTTTELLQSRFRELCAEREAIMARSAPLRAEREPILADIEEKTRAVKALTAQIRAIEDPRLAECMNEIAMLVRALNGKTGLQS